MLAKPAIFFAEQHYFDLCLFFHFSPLILRVNRYQTLPHVQRWPRFIKFGQKFGSAFHKNFGSPKTKTLAQFQTPWQLDDGYLWNATRHRQMGNSTAKCDHFYTLVNFGLNQTNRRPSYWELPHIVLGITTHHTGNYHTSYWELPHIVLGITTHHTGNYHTFQLSLRHFSSYTHKKHITFSVSLMAIYQELNKQVRLGKKGGGARSSGA